MRPKLVSILLLACAPAFASTVTYSTTGSFASGPGVLTGANGLTLNYQNAPAITIDNAGGTNTTFSQFKTTGPSAGTDPLNSTFELTITQKAPTLMVETLAGSITGTISADSSNGLLTFTGGAGDGGAPIVTTDPLTGETALSFRLGGVQYYVDQKTGINYAETGGGVSVILGAVTPAAGLATPEPGYLAAIGAGFAGLMALRRRAVYRA
jgi:hypothetical protein